MNLVFCGTPRAALPSLEALHALGHRIALVVTPPDKPEGRHGTPHPPPLKERALALGLPVFQTADINLPEAVEQIRRVAADLLVVVAFGQKLKKPVREIARRGAINLHFSLLPRWRGAAPVARALMAGDEVTGVTIFRIVGRMDAGPLLASSPCLVLFEDTTSSLEERLAKVGASLLGSTVASIGAGHAVEKPQDDTRVTLAPKVTKEEAAIDWAQPALSLHRRIRALVPWPVAQTYGLTASSDRPVRVLVHAARLVRREEASPEWPPLPVPGMVLSVLDDAIVVACRDAPIALTRLQPESRKVMDARAFANGHHLAPGDGFGPPDWLLRMRRLAADLEAIGADVGVFDLKRLAAAAQRFESEDGWEAIERMFSGPAVPGSTPPWISTASPSPHLREIARVRPEIAAIVAALTPEEARNPHLIDDAAAARLASATGQSPDFVRRAAGVWLESYHRWEKEGARWLLGGALDA
ncbi:MAG: methionyl-tRNA formyltransferase [Planctomycetes bacterium]|nr:methionyl-tRNA formyltransferase [Planctomycetota bacterium]